MNIGILGYGTIGKGVAELIRSLPASYGIKTVKILDREEKRAELQDLYAATKEEVCCNAEIDVVVEALGGDEFACACITQALKNGKHVVTSNKEVVSKHIEEFYALAKEKGVYFWCEAAVGGGIPLICSLIDQIAYNEVTEIYGIINGTTNFVLTRMCRYGESLEAALETARALGFAERDASADLEGLDMVRKIAILSSVAYGGLVSYQGVGHYGIGGVSKEFLTQAEEAGYTLKFVASSKKEGQKVYCAIEPVLLKKTHPLALVKDEFNSVTLVCSSNGELTFCGKGAGRYPTASAVVADLMRIKNNAKAYYFKNAAALEIVPYFNGAEYYVQKGGETFVTANRKELVGADFYARIF